MTSFGVHRQTGRNLGADETAANDGELPATLGEGAQAPVVRQRPQVHEVVATEGQAAWGATGRQQQLLEGEVDSPVVGRLPGRRIQRNDAPPEQQLDAAIPALLQTLSRGAPFHSAFERGGRSYGLSGSSPMSPIEPLGSTSRIPVTAASPVIPAPTIRYLKCGIGHSSSPPAGVVIRPAVDQGANLASTWLVRPRVGGRRGDAFLQTCEFAADIPPGTAWTANLAMRSRGASMTREVTSSRSCR